MRHRAFFDKVQKARESCGGDTSMYHTVREVKNFIFQAITQGRQNDVPSRYIDLCYQALYILEHNSSMKARVAADKYLCEVLNTMLKEER